MQREGAKTAWSRAQDGRCCLKWRWRWGRARCVLDAEEYTKLNGRPCHSLPGGARMHCRTGVASGTGAVAPHAIDRAKGARAGRALAHDLGSAPPPPPIMSLFGNLLTSWLSTAALRATFTHISDGFEEGHGLAQN